MTSYSHPFIFRMPAGTPDLDFASLEAYINRAYDGEELHFSDHAMIGTTARITWRGSRRPGLELPPRIDFQLYDLVIARIFPDQVTFPGPDDPHMATTEWIARIVHDNAIGGWVGRIRRVKADGPGPAMSRGQAGLLVIGDRSRPVFGRTYPVGDIEGQRAREREQQERWAAEQERYAAESQRREALKTWTGPEGTFYAIDDCSPEHHWRVVDGTFQDGGASYNTIGSVRDARGSGDTAPGYLGHLLRGSPEPDGTAVFAAFAGRAGHPRNALGAFVTLAGAIAAVAHTRFPAASCPASDQETGT